MKTLRFSALLNTFSANYIRCASVALLTAAAGFTAQSQQSFTFTPAGATGQTGPTQAMVTAYYGTTNLAGSVTIGSQQGIQMFTIPANGAYRIDAYGGAGYGGGIYPGRGAKITGEFNFTAGQVIKILVGQQGVLPSNSSYNAQYGGGGGSFVTDNSNVPLVVAGGGGANWASNFSAIADAPITTNGNASGGTGATGSSGGSNGGGGGTANSSDGGGGFTSNGSGTSPGSSFMNGGNGGFTTYGIGGFGGGAGTSSYNNRRAAGGGGYSGGGGAEGGTTGYPEGGGGGSYNSGVNQVNVSGVNMGDGMVVVTKLCNVNLTAATNPICYGDNVTLNTNAVGTVTWSSSSSAGTSIVVSPTITTTYSVIGTGTINACIGTAAVVITVMPLPSITAVTNPPLLCVGKSATLSALGAANYTWTTAGGAVISSTAIVSPLANTSYTVTGASSFGCLNTASSMVNVSSSSLSVNSPSPVCEGAQVSLHASGATTYTWNGNIPLQGITVSPQSTTVYTVTANDVNNCLLTQTVAVIVNAIPVITVSASQAIICRNQTVTLSSGGASTYVWSDGSTTSSITQTLLVDVPYTFTVTGTDANGCSGTAVKTVYVSKCVGIEELSGNQSVNVYPNPAQSAITVATGNDQLKSIEIIDISGRTVLVQSSRSGDVVIDLHTLASGVYYVKVNNGQSFKTARIIKQ